MYIYVHIHKYMYTSIQNTHTSYKHTLYTYMHAYIHTYMCTYAHNQMAQIQNTPSSFTYTCRHSHYAYIHTYMDKHRTAFHNSAASLWYAEHGVCCEWLARMCMYACMHMMSTFLYL